jgi:hypothetical protein
MHYTRFTEAGDFVADVSAEVLAEEDKGQATAPATTRDPAAA